MNLSEQIITDQAEETKEDTHRFLEALYGRELKGNYLVLWTKHDKEARFFTDIDSAATEAEMMCRDQDVYFSVCLLNQKPQQR